MKVQSKYDKQREKNSNQVNEIRLKYQEKKQRTNHKSKVIGLLKKQAEYFVNWCVGRSKLIKECVWRSVGCISEQV